MSARRVAGVQLQLHCFPHSMRQELYALVSNILLKHATFQAERSNKALSKRKPMPTAW